MESRAITNGPRIEQGYDQGRNWSLKVFQVKTSHNSARDKSPSSIHSAAEKMVKVFSSATPNEPSSFFRKPMPGYTQLPMTLPCCWLQPCRIDIFPAGTGESVGILRSLVANNTMAHY
uniref:Uncharacterized protein n=1 Tax=Coccidioides posadasii RMSCC 3488 TaxID=454284 RepID=A0A0J6FGP3_COCPO|nr:hypothetical protein CPAG_04396 [Coccidioides posadasii RMSCC 3488]